ncbi:hypothetical protein BH18THE1_BH18THE1_13310 [soil metagenome]
MSKHSNYSLRFRTLSERLKQYNTMLPMDLLLAAQDLCGKCRHARSSHKNELGESGTMCGWPHCDCKKFLD